MQPSNTLLAPSRFMSSDIRFVRSFVIVFVAFAALFLTACNQNTPDDTKKGGDTPTSQHQPANPATWSPAGKKYIHDCSGDKNEYGYEFLVEVIAFYTKDSAANYSTTNRDLTPSDFPHYDPAHYTISYPNVRVDYGGVVGNYVFTDTLTLKAFDTFTLATL